MNARKYVGTVIVVASLTSVLGVLSYVLWRGSQLDFKSAVLAIIFPLVTAFFGYRYRQKAKETISEEAVNSDQG
jgi:uncharacterized membrane protein YfcA